MNKIKNALYRFMYGRYGNDNLGNFLMVLMYILLLLNMFAFNNGIVYVLVWFILMFNVFRTFSKNIVKRRNENNKYLKLTQPIRKRFKMFKTQKNDKANKYFICPSCSQSVRVPKGKGKIVITCPKCQNKFERKS